MRLVSLDFARLGLLIGLNRHFGVSGGGGEGIHDMCRCSLTRQFYNSVRRLCVTASSASTNSPGTSEFLIKTLTVLSLELTETVLRELFSS